jgi:hypothetical protein
LCGRSASGLRISCDTNSWRPISLAFFSVLDERANEIVLGADDRHLDFRLSLMRNISENGEQGRH